jgi:hypothetical protein
VLFAHGYMNAPGTRLGDASANAINDSGVIVGQGGNGDTFVYQNGHATDLNSLIAVGSGCTLRREDREHCASITCVIRHYVARRAKVIFDHPHNAADRSGWVTTNQRGQRPYSHMPRLVQVYGLHDGG